MANKFHFPASTYYNKSTQLKRNLETFTEEVESQIIKTFDNNSDGVDDADLSYIKSASGYSTLTSCLTSLTDKYQKKLTFMSTDNGSNPMYGVVEKDKNFSMKFTNIDKGNIGSELQAATAKFNNKITLAVGKDFLDSDTLKRLSKIGVNVKDINDLVKMLDGTKDPKKLAEVIAALKGNERLVRYLAASDKFLQGLKNNKYLADIISETKVFTDAIKNVMKDLGMLSDLANGNVVKALVNRMKDAKWFGKVKGALGKASIAILVVDAGIKGINNFNANKKDFRDGKVVRGTLKTAAGTAIDMASDVGMIEGAALGAQLGSVVPFFGTGVGAVGGLIIGGANQVAQIIWPNMYTDLKKTVNGGIDKLADGAQKLTDKAGKLINDTGKSIGNGIDNMKNNISNAWNGVCKSFAW